MKGDKRAKEFVTPDSLLTFNSVFGGLVKVKLLWIKGDWASVEVTERKHPFYSHKQTVEVLLNRLSSRQGWRKSRVNPDRLYYTGRELHFSKQCFV